jgi:hypothetical protein
MDSLEGKGYFIWKVTYCDRGDPVAMVERARSAGLTHVLIKIADGANWAYNYDYKTKVDFVPPVLEAFHEAGIDVWGWHYVRGDDPVGEARLGIDRVRELGVDGYVIDAEIEYKKPGKRLAAKRYMSELRAALPNLPMALSTFRYPARHSQLPYAEFLQGCDYAMPQVYFEGAHNPDEQLQMSFDQFSALQPSRPVIPTAPTYSIGGWRPTVDDITLFGRKALELRMMGMNAWSWDYATRANQVDLWSAVADFDWSPKPPGESVPDELISNLNSHDVAFVPAMYLKDAAHVTGARTAVGVEAIQAWYTQLFGQLLPGAMFQLTGKHVAGRTAHFTWNATSDRGSVLDGNDTISLKDGKIQYHYTYFTLT